MPTAKVYTADCRDVMKHLIQDGQRVDMVFADPPFNIGQTYAGYNDRQSAERYETMLNECLRDMHELIRPGGVICLHGPNDLVYHYEKFARALPDFPRIDWVNWCYSFSQYTHTGFSENRTHCLVYRKGSKIGHTFNAQAVSIPSVRMLLGDARAAGKRVPGAIWGLKEDEAGVPLEPTQNLPGWGRVVGNHPEREHSRPNQLPLAYLKRLIAAYTFAGQTIFDPFCGTGTTAVAALQLGCNAITCDIDSEATVAALARINRTIKGQD